MRVLVTGGTGYLGQAVVRALTSAGHEPVVFSRASGDDIRDRERLDRAAARCGAVFHLAALVSLWRPRRADFDEINVGGLRNVLDVVQRRGIPKLLYTSSFLAMPPRGVATPLMSNDYQRTKVLAEKIASEAATSGAPIVRLYPGVIYGPGRATEGNLIGNLVRDHLAGRLPGVVGADREWSYAFVEDVAEAHVRALERAPVGTAYTLGGDNAPQMRVFEIVRDLTGRPTPRRIPFSVASMLGAVEEAKAAIFRRPPLLTRGTVDIFRHDWSLDSAAAVRDLGLRIRPLAEGVERLLASVTAASDRKP